MKKKTLKPTIQDYTEFLGYLENLGLSEGTIRVYKYPVKQLVSSGNDLNKLETYQELLDAHAHKKRNNCMKKSIRHFLKFKFGNKSEQIINQLRWPKELKPIMQTYYFDDEARNSIIDAINKPHYKLIAKIQNALGVRAGDVLRLTRDSIQFQDYEDDVIMQLSFITKGNQSRKLFILNPELQNEIVNHLQKPAINDKYIFVKENNKIPNVNNMNSVYRSYMRELNRAAQSVGYNPKFFRTHDFRRAFGLEVYYDAGKDPLAAMEGLGHQSLDVTMRYLKISGVGVKDILKKRYEKRGI